MTVNDLTPEQYAKFESTGAFEYMAEFGFTVDDILNGSGYDIEDDDLSDSYDELDNSDLVNEIASVLEDLGAIDCSNMTEEEFFEYISNN